MPLIQDRDGNRIRDSLDEKARTNPETTVYVHLLYGRRPTADDADLLQQLGASRTYVFQNWDWIKVESKAALVAQLLGAPGVIAVEEFVPPIVHNVIAAQTTLVRETPGAIADGYDHMTSLNEDLGLKGEGMVVAILDTGVDNTHEMLDDLDDDPNTDDPKLVQKIDPATGVPIFGAADASDGFIVIGCVDPVDDHFHGTHVAGTAVGTSGGLTGLDNRGAAPQARLVDVDIAVPIGPGLAGVPGTPIGSAIGLGEDIAFDWIIDYNEGTSCFGDPGEFKIDVASMSFGAGGDGPGITQNVGITDVVRSGMTFTLSAGNGGDRGSTLNGGAEGAIIVAASDDRNTANRADDYLADFSSRGPRASDSDQDPLDELRPDIAAPGVNINSALLHSGVAIVGASGTSMSTPHVAGIATLILQAADAAGIDVRPVDRTGQWKDMGAEGAVPIRDILQKTAQYRTQVEPGSAPAQVTATGKFGLPWNNGWGYGLVDAFAAVDLALNGDDDPAIPDIRITSPEDGTVAKAGVMAFAGRVDRTTEGPLLVDAGGPYAGSINVPLAITSQVRGGTGSYACSWASANGAAFADAHACATTITYAAAGTDVLRLTATDGIDTLTDDAEVVVESIGPGALYLTSTVLAPANGCNGTPRYSMSTTAPAPGKAYSGMSAGGFACAFQFQYTATRDSVLRNEIKVQLLIGCDLAGHAIEVDYNVLVNGVSISANRPAVSYTCTSTANRFAYEQSFDGQNTPIATGNTVTLSVSMFAAATGLQGTPAQNWHIKTGDPARPSGLFGMGFPMGAPGGTGGSAPSGSLGSSSTAAAAPTTQSLYFHNAGGYVGNLDNALGDPTYMDDNYPTFTDPAVAVGPRVRGAYPGTAFDPNWVHPGDLDLRDVDITITWYAETLGYGAALGDKWIIEVWVDDGDGVWTRNDAVTNANNPDILAYTDAMVDNQAFFQEGPDGIAKRTWTFKGLTASNPDGKFAIVLMGLFGDRDTATAVFYDAVAYASGVTITYNGGTDALAADAGGPYQARVGSLVPIRGSFTGGDGTGLCAWTSADDAVFADASACETTVEFSSAGSKVLTLTVTDGTGSASDEAEVMVKEIGPGERIEFFVNDETTPRAVIPVSTAADDALDFEADVDLSDLTGAVHVVAAWKEDDGTLIASDAIDLTLEPNNGAPTATIAGPSSSKKSKDITFSGAQSKDPEGSVLTYAWDLGDGTTATTMDVTHRYKREGTYTVRLTVTDDLGATDTATHTVTIGK